MRVLLRICLVAGVAGLLVALPGARWASAQAPRAEPLSVSAMVARIATAARAGDPALGAARAAVAAAAATEFWQPHEQVRNYAGGRWPAHGWQLITALRHSCAGRPDSWWLLEFRIAYNTGESYDSYNDYRGWHGTVLTVWWRERDNFW